MALSRGYIRFFEPDVYVEAEQGLAAEFGIREESGSRLLKRVVTLEDFVTYKDGHQPEFAFGLNILDIYAELYSKEYRFEPRHPRQVLLFEDSSDYAMFAEAASGAFPEDDGLSFIRQGYLDVFEPKVRKLNASNWASALEQHCDDPLSVTSFGFDSLAAANASWKPRLFIADPKSPHDIIDLWNLRLFCDHVLPVNIHWLNESRDFLRDFIRRTYRPLLDNPHGVITNTTVEFGRSITPDQNAEICGTVFNDLVAGSWNGKAWYDPIWESHPEDWVPKNERAMIDAKTERLELGYEPGRELQASFHSLSPSFAQRYGANGACWVNVLNLADFADNSALALAMPSTRLESFASRLSGLKTLLVSREGFVLPQRYRDSTQHFRLPTGREAIREWLREQGIIATHADSGRIADQILSATDGFRGAYLLSHAETLQKLDKMSKSVRTYAGGETTEEYPDRTAHLSDWLSLINRRKAQNFKPALDIQAFVKAKALRLGLEIKCSNCEYRNWYGLGHLKERVTCERCLQQYEFPQGTMNPSKTPWRYRVTGPFSVPDYARGAYSTVLALRCLAVGLNGHTSSLTYSSNLNLDIGGRHFEIDFACWHGREPAFWLREEPAFVVGETKSFAEESIYDQDIDKLKTIGRKLPGTVLAFAVLKDELSPREKRLVGRLALWGREQLEDGRWRAPVIVLTSKELFAIDDVGEEWRKSRGLRKRLIQTADFRMDNLTKLADLTQQVYLGLPDYLTWLKEGHARRQSQRGTESEQ